MYGLVLYHLQGVVVILDDMPVIDVCVELLQTETH